MCVIFTRRLSGLSTPLFWGRRDARAGRQEGSATGRSGKAGPVRAGSVKEGLRHAELRLSPLGKRLPAAVGLPSLPDVERARRRVLLEHPQPGGGGARVAKFLLRPAQQQPADAAALQMRGDVERADVSRSVLLELEADEPDHVVGRLVRGGGENGLIRPLQRVGPQRPRLLWRHVRHQRGRHHLGVADPPAVKEDRAELVNVVAAGDPEQGHAADAMSKISRFARGPDRSGTGARGWGSRPGRVHDLIGGGVVGKIISLLVPLRYIFYSTAQTAVRLGLECAGGRR